MEETTYQNSVYLCGEMCSEAVYSHTIYGEGFYHFYLKVPRLSGKKDILPMTVSERLLDYYHVAQGDHFAVSGQLRSYNKKNPDHTNRLMVTVFVKDILKQEPADAVRNPNEVELDGFICKQPVYRTTPLGREITDVLLAVNRAFHKSDYIPCIVWGRNAQFAGTLCVGSRLRLSGRLQSRDYEKLLPSGESVTRTAYEVSLNNLEQLR